MKKNISLFFIVLIVTLCSLEVLLKIIYPQNLVGWYAYRDDSGLNLLKKNIKYYHRINERNIQYNFGNLNNRITGNYKNENKILIVGDSFTFGWLIKDKSTYVDIIQNHFSNFYFVNTSVPGWGLSEQVRFVENYCKKISPQKIILMIGTDDISRAWLSNLYKFEINDLNDFKKNQISKNKQVQLNYESKFHKIPFYKFLIKNSHLFVLLRQTVVNLRNNAISFKKNKSENNKFEIPYQSLGKYNKKSIVLAKMLYLRLNKLSKECGSDLLIIYSGWYNYNIDDKNPTLIFLKEAKKFFEENKINYFDFVDNMIEIHHDFNSFIIANDHHPNENGHKKIADNLIKHLNLN